MKLGTWILSFLLVSQAFAGRYDNIVDQLEDLQRRYSTFAQMVTMGRNDQGTPIRGLRIEVPNSGDKTNQLVVGTHHGNEHDAAPMSVAFAEEVLNTFETRGEYYAELKDDVFFVFPVLNISGYDTRRRTEKSSTGRWLDPNRDYPDACAQKDDFQLKSTTSLSRFVYDNDIVGSITVHGYVGTFTFPWGFYTEDTHSPDHNHFMDITKYAVEANGYRVGTHKDVIYPASGSYEDWAYLEHGVWVALLEMKRFPNYDKDVEAMMRFFTAVPDQRSNYHNHDGACTPASDIRSSESRP